MYKCIQYTDDDISPSTVIRAAVTATATASAPVSATTATTSRTVVFASEPFASAATPPTASAMRRQTLQPARRVLLALAESVVQVARYVATLFVN